MNNFRQLFFSTLVCSLTTLSFSQADSTFRIFQFPASQIPRIDGNASQLRTFRLMPLEQQYIKKIDANWSFKIVDMNRRLVAFQDESIGKITSWKWEFGDGTSSAEQHPVHAYAKSGRYIVTLYIEGPDGKSRRAKVWDVAVKSSLDNVKSN